MKTWEMIKELTENPKKEFRHNTCVGDYFIAKTTNEYVGEYVDIEFIRYDRNGEMNSCGSDAFLRLNLNWEEVKQPVSFMEAIKVFHKGGTIRCLLYGEEFTYTHCLDIDSEKVLEGQWFID